MRALPLEGVAQVEVARIYCGAVPIRCGTAVGPTLRYAVDLEAARLTTTRCFTPDAGAAAQPEVSRVLDAEQLRQVREALASVRVAEAEINALDGRMQTLSLTQSDGTVTRYSPEAACGERRYQQVVEGYAELWRVISSLDPE